MDFKGTIPKRLSSWTPAEYQSLNLSGTGCSKCLQPDAVECCKFQPLFYNFHLGEIMADGVSKQGRLLDRLSQSWVLPLGARPKKAVKPYPQFCDLFAEEIAECSIWSHRPPECAAYFCEGDADLKNNFLKLNQRWHQYEATVAQMALVEMGFSREDLKNQLNLFNCSENAVLKLTESELREIWRDFWRREVEFYLHCQMFAEKLQWREIEKWV